jgi:hypothetical protein
MTGDLKSSRSTGNNPLFISSTANNANNCINIKNNSTYQAFIGVCGSAFGGNYANNFLIESQTSSTIFNTNGRTSTSPPNMMFNSAGNIGIGTTNPNGLLTLIGTTQLQPKIT